MLFRADLAQARAWLVLIRVIGDFADISRYCDKINKLAKKAEFDALSYDKKDEWASPIWGVEGDRVEKIPDPSRGSVLTVHYYNSTDGVCRTALASVSGQIHECRHHSIENAWKFISQFSK